VWLFIFIDTGTRDTVIVDTETRDGWARAESVTETGPMGAHSADVVCLERYARIKCQRRESAGEKIGAKSSSNHLGSTMHEVEACIGYFFHI
jgi:hypothetical protein